MSVPYSSVGAQESDLLTFIVLLPSSYVLTFQLCLCGAYSYSGRELPIYIYDMQVIKQVQIITWSAFLKWVFLSLLAPTWHPKLNAVSESSDKSASNYFTCAPAYIQLLALQHKMVPFSKTACCHYKTKTLFVGESSGCFI